MIRDNIVFNLNRVPESDFAFPAGNTMVSSPDEVGFENAAAKDFRLSAKSRFRGKSSTGKDPGSSLVPPFR
jgi:hypothetical protein